MTISVLVAAMLAALADQSAGAQPAPARYVLCEEDCAIVDESGAIVTKQRFEKLEPFIGPAAIYMRKQKAGATNTDGRTVLKAKYDTLALVADHLLIAGRTKRGGRAISEVYDLSGRRLYRSKEAGLFFDTWDGHLYHYQECPDGTAFESAGSLSWTIAARLPLDSPPSSRPKTASPRRKERTV